MHHSLKMCCPPSRCLGFCKTLHTEPSENTSVGLYPLSPSFWVSSSLFSAPQCCFPQLPSRSFTFCSLPFEGSFAKLFRKGRVFCFHCLNENMNECEGHQKASHAPEQSPSRSGSQPTPTPPAKEVSGAGPSSHISEYFVVSATEAGSCWSLTTASLSPQ